MSDGYTGTPREALGLQIMLDALIIPIEVLRNNLRRPDSEYYFHAKNVPTGPGDYANLNKTLHLTEGRVRLGPPLDERTGKYDPNLRGKFLGVFLFDHFDDPTKLPEGSPRKITLEEAIRLELQHSESGGT